MSMIESEYPRHFGQEWKHGKRKLLPAPTWVNSGGKRRYQFSPPPGNYKITADNHVLLAGQEHDHLAFDQVLGVQVIAVLSPEITGREKQTEDEEYWPSNSKTPSGSYPQFMGPLQAAVAALFTPKEWEHIGHPGKFSLVYADILGAAEEYIRYHGTTYGNEHMFQRYFVMPASSISGVLRSVGNVSFPVPTINISNPMTSLLNHRPETRASKRRRMRKQGRFKS